MLFDLGNGEDALSLLDSRSYDLVILDISMPGMGGMELLPLIHQNLPDLPVLMLSMFPEEQFALRAFRMGACGYLTKKEAADELLLAVSRIFEGGRYISSGLSNSLLCKAMENDGTALPAHSALSNREFQILRALATGKSLKSIAFDIGLSIKTVSTYKARIFNKLGFRSDEDLICYARRNSLE